MNNLPATTPLTEVDYEAIEAAVMETARGRWFLAEYARRNRNADTTMLLKALDRIEDAIGGRKSVEPVDRIRFDLVEMAKSISRTKAEIASIKADADDHGKFGEASQELDSIVQATEKATSDILACSERVQEIAWTMREQGVAPEICDLLDANATEIYTACSFQDLTGQRISKVITVLRYLESRINAMIGIWGLDGAMAAEHAEARAVDEGKSLLNGPALPGQGLDQADVDMVMGPAAHAEAAQPVHAAAEEAAPVEAEAAPPEAEVAPADAEVAPPLQPAYLDADDADEEDEPEIYTPRAEAFHAPAHAVVIDAEPVAAAPRVMRSGSDPLAPINDLSPDEKIALFS